MLRLRYGSRFGSGHDPELETMESVIRANRALAVDNSASFHVLPPANFICPKPVFSLKRVQKEFDGNE